MSSGQGAAKETCAIGNNPAAPNTTGAQQKKKRPRQRQRPRNKAQLANSKATDGQEAALATPDAANANAATHLPPAAAIKEAAKSAITTLTAAPVELPNQLANHVARQRESATISSINSEAAQAPVKHSKLPANSTLPTQKPQETAAITAKSVGKGKPNQTRSPTKANANAKPLKADATAPKSPTKTHVSASNTHLQQSNSHQTSNSAQNNHTSAANHSKSASPMNPVAVSNAPAGAAGKSREEIMAEREAKKLAKQAKKVKPATNATPNTSEVTSKPSAASVDTLSNVSSKTTTSSVVPKIAAATNVASSVAVAAANDASKVANATEKTREQIKAEREAKKQSRQALKSAKSAAISAPTEQLANAAFVAENASAAMPTTAAALPNAEDKKKPALSKAERRAVQEAQRAAKAQALSQKAAPSKASTDIGVTKKSLTPATAAATRATPPKSGASSPVKTVKTKDCKVKLFNHLESACKDVSLFVNNAHIHPSIARLGEQYAKRTVVGSNARCIAFLNALKLVIKDFETPPKKEFARSLETTITNCVDYLQKCRPLAVSVCNAYKHIKHVLTQLPADKPESDLKVSVCRFIDTYIENQIDKAAEAISYSMQEKISNGDVILTFGCSSLINYIFEEAQRRRVDFRVIVVDSRPFCEGQELLRRLAAKEIPCSYVLINAVSFVMPEATKVLLGAHALLANGYVMARTGTAQVALVAHSFNVPVLVCCETHKFSERFQTDAIVYNELGNPDDLILSDKCCLTNWQAKNKMSPLNLMYDITPPELVTAVVTEVSILPCTSVPVILRIKPTEIGYY